MVFYNRLWNLLPGYARNSTRILSQKTCVPLNRPVDFTFDITDRCHSRCLTCTKWRTPPESAERELTSRQWKKVILDIKDWLGEFHFIFAGGEPFLRKDIFEICAFANKNAVKCSVISNGFGFSPLADQIVHSGFHSILVSLNGYKDETHDATRGVKGAYSKTIDFIKEVNTLRKPLARERPRLTLNSILMPFNCEEAVDLVKWVQHEGIDGIRFQPLDPPGAFHPYPVSSSCLSIPKGAGGEWYLTNFEENAKLRIKPVVDRLIELKKLGYPIENSVESIIRTGDYYTSLEKYRRECEIGVLSFNVDPYGNVRFCFDMAPIGNILETPPGKLYFSKNAVATRQRIRDCKKTCHWAVC